MSGVPDECISRLERGFVGRTWGSLNAFPIGVIVCLHLEDTHVSCFSESAAHTRSAPLRLEGREEAASPPKSRLECVAYYVVRVLVRLWAGREVLGDKSDDRNMRGTGCEVDSVVVSCRELRQPSVIYSGPLYGLNEIAVSGGLGNLTRDRFHSGR